MKIVEHKPSGVSERTLTDAEVLALAKRGDREAIREVLKKKWATATQAEKITLLAKALRILDM